MMTLRNMLATAYWLVVFVLFAAMVALLFTYTPIEQTMGPIQKVFYLHLPVAINTFLVCAVVAVASVGYLWQRHAWWDDLAAGTAKIAVLLCSVVLLTGVIWAHSAWGTWWQWTPRLTFTLVLWLLYVGYIVIRASVESRERRALISAVYGLLAFLDVPLVYLSVRLMPEDLHPVSIDLAPAMRLTLGLWFIPVTLLTIGLIVLQFKLNCRIRSVRLASQSDASQQVAAEGTEVAL